MTEAVTPPNPAGSITPQSRSSSMTSTPDPTLLTIDSIRREIAMLENLMNNQIEAKESLTAERFHRVDEMMERSEEQRREQKSDTKSAVDAALQAQIEATQKMERSISDQLASLRSNFETSIGAVQSNVSDLKDRLTIIESKKEGQVEQKTESRQVTAGVYAAIGIGITIILFAITVVGIILAAQGDPSVGA